MSNITLKVKLSIALLVLAISVCTPVFALSLIPAARVSTPMAMEVGTTAS